MVTSDFETKLDRALAHLAEGKADDGLRDMPEATDLIKVAQRLQILKLSPEPRLAEGRQRFMSEAARHSPARARSPLPRLLARPVLAFLTAFILFASGMIFMSMRASMGDLSYTPSPSSSPTLTRTPTNTAFGRMDSLPVAPTRSIQQVGPNQPEPAPTPAAPRVLEPTRKITILRWQSSNG